MSGQKTALQLVRSIPDPNRVADRETQRVLRAMKESLTNLGMVLEEVTQAVWKGRNGGAGAEVFAGLGKDGAALFRSLVAGGGVSITANGEEITVAAQTTALDYKLKVASGGSPDYLGDKLKGTGTDVGAVDLVEGVTDDDTVGIRKLVGDGGFVKVEITEVVEDVGGGVKISFAPAEVTGYDAEKTQVAAHALGVAALLELVTEVGATGSDTKIPTEQGVRELFDSLAAAANRTSKTMVTALQVTSAGLIQVKTNTLTAPTAWWGTETGWTTIHTAEELACP